MAVLTLPITNEDFNYKFTTALDGVSYIMDIRFNSRLNRWVLSLFDSQETPLVTGKLIMINALYWVNFKDDRIPKGIAVAFNVKDDSVEPNEDNFGKDVLLLYGEAV